jgi:hypothetical protein
MNSFIDIRDGPASGLSGGTNGYHENLDVSKKFISSRANSCYDRRVR